MFLHAMEPSAGTSYFNAQTNQTQWDPPAPSPLQAVCVVAGCTRETWNGQAGQMCCRSCSSSNGTRHGPVCEANHGMKGISVVPSSAVVPPANPSQAGAYKETGGRTFATSRFKQHYSVAIVPKFPHEMLGAVHGLLKGHAARHVISMSDVDPFFERLQRNALHQGGITELLNEIQHVTVRMWTSAETLRDRELCSIFNEAIREDADVECTVPLARSLNSFCVVRPRVPQQAGPPRTIRWPTANKTYRGGGLPPQHFGFFSMGTRYRMAQFLSTTFERRVANEFMQRQDEEPVLWTFHFDPELGCNHVNFIDRTDGTVGAEDEFLFGAYSAFKVRSCERSEDPHWTRPHKIELDVAADNKDVREWPEDLPLAPWG